MIHYTSTEIAQAVMSHAEAHYEDGGWDVIVECETIAGIAATISEHRADGVLETNTPRKAIKWFAEIAAVMADRQADTRNSAF